ncbi:glycosyltransferase family 1 protein [Bifidobacterium felsineum]|uniref:Glycosyl transferase n=1 Tax=Bifidobacterium felsineum TaxID=2045440 RepID=A0A2M9HHZ4_9BIFI|nr:glycosyltransferase family 1 protein [Bifidobacterium felsineum]PJM76391.1 glycosyl transferase [Bifidobacterium felsineum]
MSEPIRVAQVVGRMMGGGVEATVMNHYRHIDRDKVQFDFIVQDDSTVVPTEEIESLGGRVFTIPSYKQLPLYIKECERLFRELKPTIVHSHMNALSVFPLGAAKRAGVPVRIAHSHSTSNPREYAKTAVKMALRPFSRVYPTHYAACSHYTAQWLFGSQLDKAGKVRIIHNAIEPETFRFNPDIRAAKRAELGISDDQLLIGQVGRMCFQKNQLFTLDVFKQVLERRPDAILALAGDGDMMNQVKQRIHELSIEHSVHVLGIRNDVYELYQAFDVLAFPSTYEGLGMAAIEAQAADVPVIASNHVPSEAQIIPNSIRYLPLNEPTRWADVLYAISPFRKRVNKSNLIRAAGYDIFSSTKKLNEWYHNLSLLT